MDAKFGGPVAGGGDAEHDETADLIGQPQSLPDIAVDIGIDDVLQRRAEFAGRRHSLRDVGLAEHFFASAKAARVQFVGIHVVRSRCVFASFIRSNCRWLNRTKTREKASGILQSTYLSV